MTIAKRGSVNTATGIEGSGSTLVLTKDAGVVSGDNITIAVAWDVGPALTLPSGFAHVSGSPQDNSDQRLAVFTKKAGGSEPSTYTVTGASSWDRAGAIIAHSGVDGTTQVEASGGQTNSSSSSVTAPSITTLTNNALLLGAFGVDDTSGGSPTYTPPSGMTEEADVNAGDWASIELTSETKATAGATGTRVATASITDDNAGILIALKPAAAGVTIEPGTGSVTIGHKTPVVVATENQLIKPPVANFNFSGQTPTVIAGNDITINVPVSNFDWSGQVPVVVTTDNKIVAPPVANFSFVGQVPVVVVSGSALVQPGTGAVAIDGQVPILVLTGGVSVSPPTGNVAITGQQPAAVPTGVAVAMPATGNVAIDGYPPLIPGDNPLTHVTRDATRTAHERFFADILRLTLDKCQEVYGVGNCTAGRTAIGTVVSATADTVEFDGSVTTDVINQTVRIVSNTGIGQERRIIAFDTGTNIGTLNKDWTTIPDATSGYHVLDRPNACRNKFVTCQDTPNYLRGEEERLYISRGAYIPPGIAMRPYITRVAPQQSRLDLEKGFASRNSVTINLADEPDSDIQDDPYYEDRTTPATGTYWGRFIANNPNFANRPAELLRGYMTKPFDWANFVSELYEMQNFDGPDSKYSVRLTIQDVLKRPDRTKLPVPSSGKLFSELKDIEHSGTALGGSLNTVKLASDAPVTDGIFNTDYNVRITDGPAKGEEANILSYSGAGQEVTIVGTFTQNVTTESKYEVVPVTLTLGDGEGADYKDPVVLGKRQVISIGKEQIEYTKITGDVISWPDSSYRGAFGTTVAKHKVNDLVQQCLAWFDEPFSTVFKDILNESDIPDSDIDVQLLVEQDATWLREFYRITACLPKPERGSKHIDELLLISVGTLYWDLLQQLVKFRVIAPTSPETTLPVLDQDRDIMDNSLRISNDDDDRINSSTVYTELVDGSDDARKTINYASGVSALDVSARSANEYGDKRPELITTRWLGENNEIAAFAIASRRVLQRRNSPFSISGKFDPKDYEFGMGSKFKLNQDRRPNFDGSKKKLTVVTTLIVDMGEHIRFEGKSVYFGENPAWIAPPVAEAYPDMPQFAHISENGKMPDGSPGNTII